MEMFGCVKGLESSPLRTNNKVFESCEFLAVIIITSNIEIKLRNKNVCFCVNIFFVIPVAKIFFYILETSGSFFFLVLFTESSAANNIGGCFSGESSIQSETRGYVQMKDLHTGEKVLSKTVDGVPVFSEVIMFLDKNSQKQATFIHIETEDHFSLEITDKHLIYVSKTNYSDDFSSAYAEEVQVGQFVLVSNSTNNFIPSKVVALTKKTSSGVYAPLTIEGNIVVDGVLTSCYGVMNNEVIAHAAFAPVRAVHWILQYISYPYAIDTDSEGVHWYADALYNIGTHFFDKSVLYKV